MPPARIQYQPWKQSTFKSSRPDKGQELVPRLGVLPELPEHAGRDRLRVDLLHAPHHHAHVARLDDHADAGGRHGLDHGLGDLAGEPLLDLEPATVDLHDARQLAQAEHLETKKGAVNLR